MEEWWGNCKVNGRGNNKGGERRGWREIEDESERIEEEWREISKFQKGEGGMEAMEGGMEMEGGRVKI